jgi:hypothetical protein
MTDLSQIGDAVEMSRDVDGRLLPPDAARSAAVPTTPRPARPVAGRPRLRRNRRDAGQVMPVIALLILVLTGFMALTVDAGMGYNEQRGDQNAADAGALAAAQAIAAGATLTSAYDRAADLAAFDCTGTSGVCSLILKISTSTSTYTVTAGGCTPSCPTESTITSVQAEITNTATKDLSTSAGRQYPIAATSTASIASPTGTGGSGSSTPVCGLCVMNATAAGALTATGSGAVTVNPGSIVVDSSSSTALTVTNSGTVTAASAIHVVGGTNIANSTVSPTPVTGFTAITNPLAALAAPWVSTAAKTLATACPSSPCTIAGGVYTSFTDSNKNITMGAGTYVIEGGMTLSNGGIITATAGVTIYLTCPSGYTSTTLTPTCSSTSSDYFTITGDGAFSLTAPSSGVYQGVALMVDPNDSTDIVLSNSGSIAINGTVDAPSAVMTITGNAGSAALNSVMIVNEVSATNSGKLALASTASANAPSAYPPGTSELIG